MELLGKIDTWLVGPLDRRPLSTSTSTSISYTHAHTLRKTLADTQIFSLLEDNLMYAAPDY